MATEFPTLLDIAKASGVDAVVGLIDEVAISTPEVTGVDMRGNVVPRVGASRTIDGVSYETLVRIADPTVRFRDANEGVPGTKSRYENRIVSTYTLNPRWECDKAVADRHADGPEAYIAMEGAAQVRAGLHHIARQFYYGTGNDAKGFPGLAEVVDSTMVLDAGGTTAATGSSVWAVKFGPQNVQWVWGRNGALELAPVRLESIEDTDGNRFDAYIESILAYPGLQVGNKYSVARIKDLTADSGKGLTDDLLAQLVDLFPTSVGEPDVIFMTRRSRSQWRNSRTATNTTGAPAPLPTNYEGIPVLVTDAITNTETLS